MEENTASVKERDINRATHRFCMALDELITFIILVFVRNILLIDNAMILGLSNKQQRFQRTAMSTI